MFEDLIKKGNKSAKHKKYDVNVYTEFHKGKPVGACYVPEKFATGEYIARSMEEALKRTGISLNVSCEVHDSDPDAEAILEIRFEFKD